MAPDPTRTPENRTRRSVIAATGAAGLAAIAGCSSGGDDTTTAQPETDEPASDGSGDGSSSDGGDGSGDRSSSDGGDGSGDGSSSDGGSEALSPLESGGSSTVYPIMNTAASYWQANRPADDTEYWPWEDYGIQTDKNLADYWAGRYGFEPSDDGTPPFRFTVGLSHSGTGVRKVRDGIYDFGNSSGNVEDELPDRDSYESFVDHVVGVDGQPLVVSSEIKEAGVTGITGEELKGLYKGRITNWSELGGPDKEIRVLGRAKASGTRTSFVSNVWGNPEENTQVANRYGQNQRLAQAIAQADNGISYLALAFLDTDGVEPISLTWEGTTYEYQADDNGLDATDYPLSRDLHVYTWEGTSTKEAAVLRMILHDFGQDTFVAPNNYFTLSAARQEEELSKLPEPEM
jgi:phosphate transport system substrate-binding protein